MTRRKYWIPFNYQSFGLLILTLFLWSLSILRFFELFEWSLPSLTGKPGGSFIWTNSLSLLKCLKGAITSRTFNNLKEKQKQQMASQIRNFLSVLATCPETRTGWSFGCWLFISLDAKFNKKHSRFNAQRKVLTHGYRSFEVFLALFADQFSS